jgi:hypothetical protein
LKTVVSSQNRGIKVPELPANVSVRQPWEDNPYQLFSWWDMEQFSADIYFALASYLANLRADLKTVPAETKVEAQVLQWAKGDVDIWAEISNLCESIGLRASTKCVKSILENHVKESTVGKMIEEISQLEDIIQWEMQDRLFMFIPSDRADRYNKSELFGTDVTAKMPQTQFDIVEAGNCYAAGRGTAVVFHLMRIMEIGVQAFGSKIGVVFTNRKNWQPILDEINTKI